MPRREEVDVRDEQIVADELDAASEPVGQRLPGRPVVLGEAVLDRDDRKTVDEVGPEVDHPVPVERSSLPLEDVGAVAVELARRRVECDRDLLPMSCPLRRLEDHVAGVVGRPEIRREAAFVAHARGEAAFLEQRLERVVALDADRGSRRRTTPRHPGRA